MNGERDIGVRGEHRHVIVDLGDGEPTTISYFGITLTRACDGYPEHETWLPMGAEPTRADDDTLIAALRDAMRWKTQPH